MKLFDYYLNNRLFSNLYHTMTIKGFSQLIKKKCPNATVPASFQDFRGKRIAIDMYLFMYAKMATARKHIINKTDVTQYDVDQIAVQKEWLKITITFIVG